MPPRLSGISQFQGPFNPTDEQKNALYPYLSLGFRPTATKRDANSALRALAASINAVRGLIADKPLAKADQLTVDDMLEWIRDEDDEYEKLVEAHIKNAIGGRKTKKNSKEYKALREELHSEENLGVAQLSLILDRVNLELGLPLELGVIIEGFLKIWDEDSSCWMELFPRQTQISIAGDDDSLGTTKSTKRSSNNKLQRRTVVWIWNDNAKARFQEHKPHLSAENIKDYWEGLAIPTRFKDPQARLRDQIVTEGWITSPIPAKIGEDFKKQLRLIGKKLEGKLQAHGGSADSDASSSLGPGEVSGDNDSAASEEEESEGEASGGRRNGGKGKEQDVSEGVIAQDPDSESDSQDQTDFKIFRTIVFTNKTGNQDGFVNGEPDDAARHVNGFTLYRVGDFLLDLGGRRPDAPWIASIRQMNVPPGINVNREMPMRRLQKLERAWGLPERLLTDPNGIPLPLRRVEQNIDAIAPFSPIFTLGEIVLEVPNNYAEGNGKPRIVYDYEGNRGLIREEDLTTFRNVPFGILVERERMDRIWVQMGGSSISDDGTNNEKSNGSKRSRSSSESNESERKRPRTGGKKPGLYAAAQKLQEEQNEEDSEKNEDEPEDGDDSEEEGSGNKNNEDQDGDGDDDDDENGAGNGHGGQGGGSGGSNNSNKTNSSGSKFDNFNDEDYTQNSDEDTEEESDFEGEESSSSDSKDKKKRSIRKGDSKPTSGRKRNRSPASDSDPDYGATSKRPKTKGGSGIVATRGTWGTHRCITTPTSYDRRYSIQKTDSQTPQKNKKVKDFHFAASRDDAQVQEIIKKAEQAIKEAKAVLFETHATL